MTCAASSCDARAPAERTPSPVMVTTASTTTTGDDKIHDINMNLRISPVRVKFGGVPMPTTVSPESVVSSGKSSRRPDRRPDESQTPDASQLIQHHKSAESLSYRSAESDSDNKCHQCDQTHSSRIDLLQHQGNDVCQTSAEVKSREHSTAFNNINNNKLQQSATAAVSKIYTCVQCNNNVLFCSKQQFDSHLRFKHGNVPIKYPVSEKYSYSHSPVSEKYSSVSDKYSCTNSPFNDSSVRRVLSASTPASFVCTTCKKAAVFTSKTALLQHMEQVHNISCSRAPAAADSAPAVAAAASAPPSQTKVLVQNLGSTRKYSITLRRRELASHTGSTLEDLSTDPRSDDDLPRKPKIVELYKCQMCKTEVFDTKYALSMHCRLKHINFDFECDDCNMKLRCAPFYFMKHMSTVHNTTSCVMCTLCDDAFSDVPSLLFHYKSEHGSNYRNDTLVNGGNSLQCVVAESTTQQTKQPTVCQETATKPSKPHHVIDLDLDTAPPTEQLMDCNDTASKPNKPQNVSLNFDTVLQAKKLMVCKDVCKDAFSEPSKPNHVILDFDAAPRAKHRIFCKDIAAKPNRHGNVIDVNFNSEFAVNNILVDDGGDVFEDTGSAHVDDGGDVVQIADNKQHLDHSGVDSFSSRSTTPHDSPCGNLDAPEDCVDFSCDQPKSSLDGARVNRRRSSYVAENGGCFFKCCVCSTKCVSASNLMRHMSQSHKLTGRYLCYENNCCQVVSDICSLKQHHKLKHAHSDGGVHRYFVIKTAKHRASILDGQLESRYIAENRNEAEVPRIAVDKKSLRYRQLKHASRPVNANVQAPGQKCVLFPRMRV